MSGNDDSRNSESADRTADAAGNAAQNERREALIKLGKYAAYATPMVIASLSMAQGKPISGPLSPPPPPP